MASTSRELVYQALNFENPARAPRQIWALPYVDHNHPEDLKRILNDYPQDIGGVFPKFKNSPKTEGDAYAVGRYVDEWGCVFENLQRGIIGEVKEPLVGDWQTDVAKVHIPRELLSVDIDDVNKACDEDDKFIMAACCPRPFERMQFIRGTENLYMDLLDPPDEMLTFLKEVHRFNCDLIELWAKETNVDSVMFMDDWGAQRQMLIGLDLWRELFKPLYRDYIEIGHAHGKKVFMHSDGYIVPIYEDLIEMGLDALNSQIFCMGVDALKPFAGRITFWGEIDRQQLLPRGSCDDIDQAVKNVYDNLWKNGGCIAQCEFSAGAKPENVYQVYESWEKYSTGVK